MKAASRAVLGGLVAYAQSPLMHLPDEQLLERYLASHDNDAFRCLMMRHGPMVLGVCRRQLPNNCDADDAFQATFFTLSRKASTIHPRHRVGAWLHGVARRTAAKARISHVRRTVRETKAVKATVATEEANPQEAAEVLDHALAQLPERLRVPLVLCELQERTLQEAASILGWAQGTVASRLSRGRELLKKRLGSTFTIPTVLAPLLTPQLVEATLSTVAGVAGPARQLADVVLHSIWMTKIKQLSFSVIGLSCIMAVVGYGVLRTYQATVPPQKPPALTKHADEQTNTTTTPSLLFFDDFESDRLPSPTNKVAVWDELVNIDSQIAVADTTRGDFVHRGTKALAITFRKTESTGMLRKDNLDLQRGVYARWYFRCPDRFLGPSLSMGGSLGQHPFSIGLSAGEHVTAKASHQLAIAVTDRGYYHAFDLNQDKWYKLAFFVKFNDKPQTGCTMKVWFEDQLLFDQPNVAIAQLGQQLVDGITVGGNFAGYGKDPAHPFRLLLDDIVLARDFDWDIPPPK